MSNSKPTRQLLILASCVLVAVVLVTYAPATRLQFYGDDYAFVERAGRSSLTEYLSFYFDPARQDGWYRPMQGMLFGIEWLAFGANPQGYHLVNVLVHLANTLLLFAITARVTRRWRAAFLAALIYCALPLYAIAVFWSGDADFLLAFFYLLSIYFWIRYLQTNRRRNYLAAFLFFLLALMTKEFGVTLPLVLFLIDRLVLQPPPASWREFLRAFASFRDFRALLSRYSAFLLVFVFYLPIEYAIQSRSVLTNLYGYGGSSPALANFANYLAALAFPWGLPDPLNFIWLAMVAALGAYLIYTRRAVALLALIAASVLAFLPVIFFPWFLPRYLYLAVMAFAILCALALEYALGFSQSQTKLGGRQPRCRQIDAQRGWATTPSEETRLWERPEYALSRLFALSRLLRPFAPFRVLSRFSRPFALSRPFASFALALIVFANALGTADGTVGFAELIRQTRVPFRDISQKHPTFPDDTYLYFINPRAPTSELSGMFFVRYGTRVTVASNARDGVRANLREHANAYVIWFDEEQRTREIAVEQNPRVSAPPPFEYVEPFRLEGFELANARVKRGDAIALILYWRAFGKIEKDYAVSLRLTDASGKIIAQSDEEPRGGKLPTSVWSADALVVDARVLIAPKDALRGENYRLEVVVYDLRSGATVAARNVEQFVIAPLRVQDE